MTACAHVPRFSVTLWRLRLPMDSYAQKFWAWTPPGHHVEYFDDARGLHDHLVELEHHHTGPLRLEGMHREAAWVWRCFISRESHTLGRRLRVGELRVYTVGRPVAPARRCVRLPPLVAFYLGSDR